VSDWLCGNGLSVVFCRARQARGDLSIRGTKKKQPLRIVFIPLLEEMGSWKCPSNCFFPW